MTSNVSTQPFAASQIELNRALERLSTTESLSLPKLVTEVPKYVRTSPRLFGGFVWYYSLVSRWQADFVELTNRFFCGVSRPWRRGINGCLENSIIVIRPEIADHAMPDFQRFVCRLAGELDCRVVVKHVSDAMAIGLKRFGFREYDDSEGWAHDCLKDDQSYPEVVIDVGRRLVHGFDRARGDARMQAKNGVFVTQHYRSNDLQDSTIRSKVENAIETVFNQWLEHFQVRHPWAIDDEFVRWHKRAFRTFALGPEFEVMLLLRTGDQIPVAVFAATDVGGRQKDMVFSFASDTDDNKHRMAYDLLLNDCAQSGCKWLNLGGSETESLFEFKKSIGPHELIETTHLVFDGE